MKLAELKSEFHSLIDQIDDPDLLSQFYDVIRGTVSSHNSLWQSLSTNQQKEVLSAYDESEDENNLISLTAFKSKYK